MRKLTAFVIALLSLLFVQLTTATRPVSACECGEQLQTQSFQKIFDAADVVFSGRVVAVEHVPPNNIPYATFAIETAWKGAHEKQMRVLGAPYCSAEFKQGEQYLFYGVQAGEEISPKACWPTVLITGTDDPAQIAELNKIARPINFGLPESGNNSNAPLLWSLVLAVAITFLSAGLLVRRLANTK